MGEHEKHLRAVLNKINTILKNENVDLNYQGSVYFTTGDSKNYLVIDGIYVRKDDL